MSDILERLRKANDGHTGTLAAEAIAEIKRLRADNAILAAEVVARRELAVALIDMAAGALVGQTSGSARLACDAARADVGVRTDATDASGALARAGGVA